MLFKIIAAVSSSGGLSLGGSIPWSATPEGRLDLAFFSSITRECKTPGGKNTVIMGRKTYESIGRALPQRRNIVISRTLTGGNSNDVIFVPSVIDAIVAAERYSAETDICYVIGGAEIYSQFLDTGFIHSCLITVIHQKHECDVLFPIGRVDKWQHSVRHDLFLRHIRNQKLPITLRKGRPVGLALHEYISSNGYEKGFLKTLETVLTEGFRTDDRTGVGCLTLPGQKIEYDLSGGKFPLMTTRRAFFRGIVEECLWILSGSTDARVLQEKDIHVWDGNSSREFLDSRGLQHLEEGDIGAGYGFQLRNFGADYSGCRAVPDAAAGVDQLRNLIEGIRTDPNGRRHIISLWNPAAIRNTALPPCHVLYQWIVDTTRHELHCCFYQRSSDLFIAGNWNACSAALMTYLIGHITGYIPRRVVMMIGSAHIYTNHIQQVKEQLTREPRHFPLLRIRRAPSFSAVNFDNYCFEDFELVGYEPMPAIKAPMNV